MRLDPAVFAAILAMAAATWATRIAGFVLVRLWRPTGRAKAALDAVPAAVLMAVIAPAVLATGPAESLAAAATALVAPRLPLIATVAFGVAAAVAARALLSG